MAIQYSLRNISKQFINQRNNSLIHFNVKSISYFQKAKSETNSGQSFRSEKTISLPKKMSLRLCAANEPQLSKQQNTRPLTLMMGWLNSNDRQLEKYQQLWLSRGFDVLTVRMSGMDLLVPPLGSKQMAKQLVTVLSELSTQYNEIVIHAFCIGNYQLGEAMLEAKAQDRYRTILAKIKGYVFDSPSFTSDTSNGTALRFAAAVTDKPYILYFIQSNLNVYFKLFRQMTMDNFQTALDEITAPPTNYPRLVFYSKNDIISEFNKNQALVQMWSKMGGIVRSKCWDESSHVRHYVNHKTEYEHELNFFIKCLDLKTLNK